jgi:hypothetical protein
MALHFPRNKHVSVVQYRRGVQAAGGGEGPRREVLKLSTSRESVVTLEPPQSVRLNLAAWTPKPIFAIS